MKKLLTFLIFLGGVSGADAGDVLDLNAALQDTYRACIGIDDQLHDLKVMAGINTAVTSVGTAAGVGATVTGFVKQSTDNEIEELLKRMQELSAKYQGGTPSETEKNAFWSEFNNTYKAAVTDLATAQSRIDNLTAKSKKLGNWRTGLLATGTATSIAGAAIAGTNKVDADLDIQIKNCISAVKNLRNSIMQARMDGIDITEAQSIADACDDYATVDISKINKRATGAMVSSTVGAATGLAGTITSGVANTNKTRDDDSDAGKKREKGLNTASNVLALGATAASATATVFNATQIAAIKRVASVASQCTEVLK
jgi:hypothetical protein